MHGEAGLDYLPLDVEALEFVAERFVDGLDVVHLLLLLEPDGFQLLPGLYFLLLLVQQVLEELSELWAAHHVFVLDRTLHSHHVDLLGHRPELLLEAVGDRGCLHDDIGGHLASHTLMNEVLDHRMDECLLVCEPAVGELVTYRLELGGVASIELVDDVLDRSHRLWPEGHEVPPEVDQHRPEVYAHQEVHVFGELEGWLPHLLVVVEVTEVPVEEDAASVQDVLPNVRHLPPAG